MIKVFALFKIILLLFMVSSVIQTFSVKSYAVEPEEFLQNKKQELRARNISKNVRCLVCQNQSIDDSAAPLAKDLRILIRNKIKEGYADKEIYKFLTDRYGDFVLLNPPFKRNTLLLWILPFVFAMIALYILFRYNKNSRKI
jgi:cytochrome c-type biogenesis protein CcmH